MEKYQEFMLLNWPCASRAEYREVIIWKDLQRKVGKGAEWLKELLSEKSIVQPQDLVQDPRYGMQVSRFGSDQGAARRDVCDVVVSDPHNPGQKVKARKVRSGLKRMLTDGTIDVYMYEAGEFFQKHFDVAGYCHYTTVRLDDCGGAGSDIADHMTRTMHSRGIVRNFLKELRFPDAQQSVAAWWILGHGIGFEDMAKKRKDLHAFKGCADKAYWRGITVAALQVMAELHKAEKKKVSSQKLRYQQCFSSDELSIPKDVKKYVVDTARR